MIRIEKNPLHFFGVTALNSKLKYTIHPVLLVFEENLQAFGANWYFSTRFDILKRIYKLSPIHFNLSHHITLTFTELFRLSEITHPNKLELLNLYAQNSYPYAFSFFLQENKGL